MQVSPSKELLAGRLQWLHIRQMVLATVAGSGVVAEVSAHVTVLGTAKGSVDGSVNGSATAVPAPG